MGSEQQLKCSAKLRACLKKKLASDGADVDLRRAVSQAELAEELQSGGKFEEGEETWPLLPCFS